MTMMRSVVLVVENFAFREIRRLAAKEDLDHICELVAEVLPDWKSQCPELYFSTLVLKLLLLAKKGCWDDALHLLRKEMGNLDQDSFYQGLITRMQHRQPLLTRSLCQSFENLLLLPYCKKRRTFMS